MGDKRINWYHDKKVYSNDVEADQDYYIQRFNEEPHATGVVNTYANVSLAVTAFRGDIITANQDSHIVGDTLINSTNAMYAQIFKATSNNIQQIELYLSQVSALGELEVQVRSLVDGTNKNSTISSSVLGTTSVSLSAIVTASRVIADFNNPTPSASGNPVTIPGTLVVGNYYAICMYRDAPTSGALTIYHSSVTDNSDYVDGYASFSANNALTWTAQGYSLYFQTFSAAVVVQPGAAYINGQRVAIADPARVDLVSTTSLTLNYIVIGYQANETNYEAHPRTGNPVATRIEDGYIVQAITSISPLYSDSSYLKLASVACRAGDVVGATVTNGQIVDLRPILPITYNFAQTPVTEYLKAGAGATVTLSRALLNGSSLFTAAFNLTTNLTVTATHATALTVGFNPADINTNDIVKVTYAIDPTDSTIVGQNLAQQVVASPDGSLFRIHIDDSGALLQTKITNKNIDNLT